MSEKYAELVGNLQILFADFSIEYRKSFSHVVKLITSIDTIITAQLSYRNPSNLYQADREGNDAFGDSITDFEWEIGSGGSHVYGLFPHSLTSELTARQPKLDARVVEFPACVKAVEDLYAFWRDTPKTEAEIAQMRATIDARLRVYSKRVRTWYEDPDHMDLCMAPWFFAQDLAPRSSLPLFRRMMRDNRVALDWVLLRAVADFEREFSALGSKTGAEADATLLRHARRLVIAQIYIYFDTIYCSAPKLIWLKDDEDELADGLDITEEFREHYPKIFYNALTTVEHIAPPQPEEFDLLELWRAEGRAVTEAEYPFWLKIET